MKRILPTWCKEVKKSMIDDDINVTELAERVGFSRNYVSGVVNGRVYAPEIAKVIGEDRHVTVPYMSLLAYHGWIKNTDSFQFQSSVMWKEIIGIARNIVSRSEKGKPYTCDKYYQKWRTLYA